MVSSNANFKFFIHLLSSLYQSGHTLASHQLLLCTRQPPTDLSVSLVWSSCACYTCSCGHPLRHRSALAISCKLELVCLVELTICLDRILLVSLEMIKTTETLWMWCLPSFWYVVSPVYKNLYAYLHHAPCHICMYIHQAWHSKDCRHIYNYLHCIAHNVHGMFLMHRFVQILLLCILWCMMPQCSA